ncbi:hypothetical protein [Flavobacterium sp. NRK1]|uniref:hypothetical protein n=1 Tax=Flavobacterium sp. NRK1 TaxID=2954929 RepID=UPI0020930C94|nr:hypothetical protein [Flavobacterium sp. NRK1]MCO6149070.1 hypothetical protein [Flavobacterium sp. NRK1]
MGTTKAEKIAQCVGDAFYRKSVKIDILCFSLLTLAKGTRFYEDAIEIIKGCNPDYFKDKD